MLRFLFIICCFHAILLSGQSMDIGYQLDAPRLLKDLPAELDEISGLSLDLVNKGQLLAVQDENGKVFHINGKNGALLKATTFWKDGDYEGIESVGADIWVVKSTGTLYQIIAPGTPGQRVEKFNTHLTGDNDVEGLTYDPRKNRLLLACKKDAKDDGNDKDGRYIYAFDLTTKTLGSRPAFAIHLEAVQNFLATCTQTAQHAKLCSFFLMRDEYDLAPSAIAVHPITGQLFITSSVGKVLMVLSPSGQITHLFKLDKDLFPQPEGLAFSADGTLYVSTEKRKDQAARIYQLQYQAR